MRLSDCTHREGDDTDGQRLRLLDMGMQVAQDYLFSVPLPIDDLQTMVTAMR